MSVKTISVQIEEEMLDRLRNVANYEERSVKNQILVLIRNNIAEYEREHGEIKLNKK